MKTYKCTNCTEEWEFSPEDYKYKKKYYPTTCPFCEMPRLDTFRDIAQYEGMWEAIKFVLRFRLWK